MLSNPLPAVLIGGPPHSGKSVLAHCLTRWLRSQGAPHYVLRATPDGEGDWFQAGDEKFVRLIRVKGEFNAALVQTIVATVQRRHLPLIVDAGGRPTPEQEAVLDACTHAILVAQDEAGLDQWRGLAERHGLIMIAELLSSLHGTEELFAKEPVLRARLVGLERHRRALPGLLPALGERLARLFDYAVPDLRQRHLAAGPWGGEAPRVVEVDQPLAPGLAPDADHTWAPQQAPAILAAVSAGQPLAVYGRGPGWLYALLAVHGPPASFHQYDVRLGWTQPPALYLAGQASTATLACTGRKVVVDGWPATCLDVQLASNFVDWLDIDGLSIPPVAADRGLILAGKVPHWLLVELARCYAPLVPWLAVYQPQVLKPTGGAIVVATSAAIGSIAGAPGPAVGTVLPMTVVFA